LEGKMDWQNQVDLTAVEQLLLRAREAQVVTWKGRQALKLDGLALWPGQMVENARVEVWIGAEGTSYPGIVFRAADISNYELGYAQPHTSGKWDALQYDPVFHDSNTWQLYHGRGAQQVAEVPTGEWFKLRIDFIGEQARISLNDQPALDVPRLAHSMRSGMVGVWSFLPAYFSELSVKPLSELEGGLEPASAAPEGVVDEWFIEDFGRAVCEPSGCLNLNRYLPWTLGKVVLHRAFELEQPGEMELKFGYSDDLTLSLDGQEIFTGQHVFKPSPDWAERGYVDLANHLKLPLRAGRHELSAVLKTAEVSFGWGIILSLTGIGVKLLPPIH
jgi:hypothetical protein